MTIRIPAEWELHSCCWMAWAVHPEWLDWVNKVKAELCEVICAIAKFEPVKLLTPNHELPEAHARFSGANVEIVEAPVDDIWMRDAAQFKAETGLLLRELTEKKIAVEERIDSRIDKTIKRLALLKTLKQVAEIPAAKAAIENHHSV